MIADLTITRRWNRGRGRTFESCRAHGLFKPFWSDRNVEKCTIRTSSSASVRTREAASRAQRKREAKAYWDSSGTPSSRSLARRSTEDLCTRHRHRVRARIARPSGGTHASARLHGQTGSARTVVAVGEAGRVSEVVRAAIGAWAQSEKPGGRLRGNRCQDWQRESPVNEDGSRVNCVSRLARCVAQDRRAAAWLAGSVSVVKTVRVPPMRPHDSVSRMIAGSEPPNEAENRSPLTDSNR
jgi:hypothetical protein